MDTSPRLRLVTARLCCSGTRRFWFPGFATIAIHAFTVGAMGTISLAVMTRASLGHTKRELTAGSGTLAAYGLVRRSSGAGRSSVCGSKLCPVLDLAGGA